MRTERNDERIRLTLLELCANDVPESRKLARLKAFREQSPEIAETLDRALLAQSTELQAALQQTGQHLESLSARLDDLLAPPHFPVRCLSITNTERGREVYVVSNGQCRMVAVDDGVGDLEVGTEVLLSQNLNRVLALAPATPTYGDTASLERVLADGHLLVSVQGESRTVVAAAELRKTPPKTGTLLQLDPAGILAQREISGSAAEEFAVRATPSVSFDNIGGLDGPIKRIKETILLHAQYAAISDRYSLPHSNAFLLAGRTGSGKTMLAQATCRFLGEISGMGQSRWLYVGPGDLKDMYYGNTEKRIKRLFAAAKSAAERDPAPLIVFFDELDSYLSKRSGGQLHRVHNEVTATLLAEMDGFEKHSNVWLMGATNRLDDLDVAAIRASRFGDNIITFGSLRRSGANEIFRKHLPPTIPIDNGDLNSLVESVTGVLYASNADNLVGHIQFRDGTRRPLGAKEIISGAEIAKICRLAKERAALREIECGDTGVRLEDLLCGVERFIDESAAKLKPHNIRDYVEDLDQDFEVTKFEPVRRLKAARVRAA